MIQNATRAFVYSALIDHRGRGRSIIGGGTFVDTRFFETEHFATEKNSVKTTKRLYSPVYLEIMLSV